MQERESAASGNFSKQLPDIANILWKHHSLLHNSEKLQAAFKQPPLVAYKRDTSICDALIHMKTNKLVIRETPCTCNFCKNIIKSEILSSNGSDSHKVVKVARCADRNVVYGIECVEYVTVQFMSANRENVKGMSE